MARLPRLTLAGQPHHVIQRGNNREPIFLDDADRRKMLDLLAEHGATVGIALHAYVLMDNHFHVLATPAQDDGLSRWMQAVGRQYVRYFNDRHGRTGTLWEGRFRSSLIQSDRYLLTCMAYIDLNPVRAGVVADAAAFAWSSHAHYSGRANDRVLTPHPLWWALANTPFAREAAYSEMVRAGIAAADRDDLTEATLHGWAAGDAHFAESLHRATGRRAARAPVGRPFKVHPGTPKSK